MPELIDLNEQDLAGSVFGHADCRSQLNSRVDVDVCDAVKLYALR